MAKKINITWTQPTIGQPIDDYTIEYGVSGQALTQVNTGNSSTSYEIVDLIDNEIYQLRIAGTNTTGQGDFTPIIYHYASQYPSAPLALSSGQPVSSGDLLLTWDAPEFSETNINNYAISYTPDGDNTTNINTTNTSYNITNLDCSKNVNVSIKASNTSGEGPEVVADFIPFCGTLTSIGTVTVSGETSPTEGDVDTYSVTNDGDAGNLTYAWSIVGGTGSSTTDTCEVTWGPDGAGQVTCTITSGDDAPTDSPASDSLAVTVNAAPTTPPPTTQPPSSNAASLLFDNTVGPLEVANDTALQVNNSMTLESWVYVSPSQTATNVYVFNKYNAGSSRSGYRFSYYNDTNAGTYQMRIYVGDGFNTNAFATVPSADRPSPGTWTHYAAIIDNTLSEVRLYQNGVLVGQDSLNGLESTNNNLFIGGQTAASATGLQSLAFVRITKAVRYSTNFTPSYNLNDYLDGNDPFFNDVELLITGDGQTDGDTVIVDESNNAFTITNLGTSEYNDVTPPDIPPPPFRIIVEDDGTNKYDIQADVSMDDLPAGATGHLLSFDGDMDGTIVTGAKLYIQSPSVGPTYRTDDGAPSTNAGAPDNFKAFWRSGSVPPTSGYGRDSYFIATATGYGFNGTLTIQPIDASNSPVGEVSNVVNIVLDEDG